MNERVNPTGEFGPSAAPGPVAVVVVNYNGYCDTAACLRSLRKLDYPDYRVVVVDNGSTDGSGSRLAEEFSWCEFVFNEDNEGFGGGCNSGIQFALSQGVDYVLLLNPDARVTDGALSELVSVERASGAGIVGAVIKQENGTIVNPVPSRYPDMLFYSGYRSNLPVAIESAGQYADTRWFETDRVEGAGVLFTDDLLRQREETRGRYLDDSLFMYCEEVELAMWCRRHDKTSVIATDAVIEHDSDASSTRPFQLYYLTRNRVLIAHRYLNTVESIAFDLLYVLTRVALAGRWVHNGATAVAKAVLHGLIDGYRGVRGQTR